MTHLYGIIIIATTESSIFSAMLHWTRVRHIRYRNHHIDVFLSRMICLFCLGLLRVLDGWEGTNQPGSIDTTPTPNHTPPIFHNDQWPPFPRVIITILLPVSDEGRESNVIPQRGEQRRVRCGARREWCIYASDVGVEAGVLTVTVNCKSKSPSCWWM